MILSFIISGPPRTKKNHGKVIKRGRRKFHVPSDAYASWNKSAQTQLAIVRAGVHDLPFKRPVNCKALFWRHALVGDAVGFYQGLADALEEAGIVENDRLITQWDGSRMLKDARNPRIEVTLEVL